MSTRHAAPTPLDDLIAEDLAAKRTVDEIERRIARCEHYAALPGATSSDQEAINDWRKLLAVKVGATAS